MGHGGRGGDGGLFRFERAREMQAGGWSDIKRERRE